MEALIDEELDEMEFSDELCPSMERMLHTNLIVSGPMVDLHLIKWAELSKPSLALQGLQSWCFFHSQKGEN